MSTLTRETLNYIQISKHEMKRPPFSTSVEAHCLCNRLPFLALCSSAKFSLFLCALGGKTRDTTHNARTSARNSCSQLTHPRGDQRSVASFETSTLLDPVENVGGQNGTTPPVPRKLEATRAG